MAQSRRSRAHVSSRAAALIRLAPPGPGGPGPVLRSHHPGRRGNPVLSTVCQPIRAAAAVEVSALACLLGGEAAPPGGRGQAGPGGKAM